MLNVMSLNCNYCCDKHGPWDERLKLIRSLILENRPHVAAFQAVLHQKAGPLGEIGQAWQIADITGYRYRLFASAHQEDNGDRKGQALISRIPLVFSDSRQLTRRPGHADQDKRIVLAAQVETKAGTLRIFNVHFSWIREQAEDNIIETLNFLRRFKGMALVVGDFNASENSGLLDSFAESGWVDVWNILRKNERGFTFESHEPCLRIDYALANKSLEQHLEDIRVFQRQTPDGLFRMSDHLALMVTLGLPLKGPGC
ncbi:MAG: endonuclease/exonuclease/phosphatase family protein [Candidatus Omnitrophota bacterium]